MSKVDQVFNISNFLVCILMIVVIGYGFNDLGTTFSFLNLVILIYTCVFVLAYSIVCVASLRDMHPPEILDFMENKYVQLFLLVIINFLLIGIHLVGTIIGCINIFYAIVHTVHLKLKTKENVEETATSV